MVEKLYPLEFASMDSSNTFDGHAATHVPQPLHNASLIYALLLSSLNEIAEYGHNGIHDLHPEQNFSII